MNRTSRWMWSTACIVMLGWPCLSGRAQESPPKPASPPRDIKSEIEAAANAPVTPIDLAGALRLAGVDNPQIQLARQRVVYAVALRQQQAASILPTLRAGLNFDTHTGAVQQSSGNILKLDRSALYVGGGANAVAAGTVNLPGVWVQFNVSDYYFRTLQSRQFVRQNELLNVAVRNQMLRRVADAYLTLLDAESRRSVTLLTRDEAQKVATLTRDYADAGKGKPPDADRAATELGRRNDEYLEEQGRVLQASAHLVELLNIDANIHLTPMEDKLVPMPVVPDVMPLSELLAVAMIQRPELGAQQAAIRQALLDLSANRWLPFSPNVLMGYSAGMFGGGGDMTSPSFGRVGARTDLDTIFYWSIQNLGVGNIAQIRASNVRLSIAQQEQVQVLNQVREEVADAFVRTHARFSQIIAQERAVKAAELAFREDFDRVKAAGGLPIELLDSLRLLGRARVDYINAIIQYNQAQMELYVALGQPPADMLARPVPRNLPSPLPASKP